jgi:hypothetical protein
MQKAGDIRAGTLMRAFSVDESLQRAPDHAAIVQGAGLVDRHLLISIP